MDRFLLSKTMYIQIKFFCMDHIISKVQDFDIICRVCRSLYFHKENKVFYPGKVE